MVCHDCLKLSEMTQLDFYVYCCHSIQKLMVNWLTNWILTLHSSTMSIFCCKEKLLMWTLKSSIYSYLTLATASPAFLKTMMCLELIFLYIKLVQLEFSWIRYIKYTLYLLYISQLLSSLTMLLVSLSSSTVSDISISMLVHQLVKCLDISPPRTLKLNTLVNTVWWRQH